MMTHAERKLHRFHRDDSLLLRYQHPDLEPAKS
jgi:hypothetical protein